MFGGVAALIACAIIRMRIASLIGRIEVLNEAYGRSRHTDGVVAAVVSQRRGIESAGFGVCLDDAGILGRFQRGLHVLTVGRLNEREPRESYRS